MSPRLRRVLCWVASAGCGALFAWWVFYAPYDPARVYRAVPSDAWWVSLHRGVADRWAEVTANPLARRMAAEAGIPAVDWPAVAMSPDLRPWIDKLGGRDAVLAYVPRSQVPGRGFWMLSAWVGARSQTHRWMLLLGQVPGVKKRYLFNGRPVWSLPVEDPTGTHGLTLALEEGLAFLCLSPSPRDMALVLEQYDRHAGQQGESARRYARLTAPDAGPDCGVVRWPPLGIDTLYWSIDRLASSAVEGRVAFPGLVLKEGAEDLAGAAGNAMGRWLGDRPRGVMVASPDVVRLGTHSRMEVWTANLWNLYDTAGQGPLFAGLFGDRYGGRLNGLRVPGVLAWCRVRESESAADAAVRQTLDRLNSYYQWGLVPRAVDANATVIHAVESTAANEYAEWPLDERVAYVPVLGHLTIGSCAGTLRALFEDEAPAESVQEPRWMQRMGRHPSAVLFGWLDLLEGVKTVRLALTVYGLKMVMDDASGTEQQRARLRAAKDWLDALTPFGEAEWWLDAAGPEPVLHMRLGPVDSGGEDTP